MAQKLSNFVQFMMEPDELAEYEKRMQADEMQQGSVDAVAKARELMKARQAAQSDVGARQQLENLAALPLDFSQMQTEDAGDAMRFEDAPTMQGQQTARSMQRLGALQDLAPEQLLSMQDTAGMSDRDIMEQQGLAPGGRFGGSDAAQAFRKDVTGDIGMFDAKKQEIAGRQSQQQFQQKIEMAGAYMDYAKAVDPKLSTALEYAISTATPDDSKLVDELIKRIDTTIETRRSAEQDQKSALQRAETMAGFRQQERDQNLPGARGAMIAGLEIIPGMEITDDSVKKVKTAMPSIETMKSLAQTLRNDYKKYGMQLTGEQAAIYQSLAKNLQLMAKSPELYALGVLAGPDVGYLEQVIPDPSSIKTAMSSAIYGDVVGKKLDMFVDFLDSKSNSFYSSHGFQRASQQPRPAPGQRAPLGGGSAFDDLWGAK
jgi:hypothetical protein